MEFEELEEDNKLGIFPSSSSLDSTFLFSTTASSFPLKPSLAVVVLNLGGAILEALKREGIPDEAGVGLLIEDEPTIDLLLAKDGVAAITEPFLLLGLEPTPSFV